MFHSTADSGHYNRLRKHMTVFCSAIPTISYGANNQQTLTKPIIPKLKIPGFLAPL